MMNYTDFTAICLGIAFCILGLTCIHITSRINTLARSTNKRIAELEKTVANFYPTGVHGR